MEDEGVVGTRKEEDDEGEMRRLGLHRVWITITWCLGSMCQEILEASLIGCEDVFSPSLEQGGCATKSALSAIAQGQSTMSQNEEWEYLC